MDVLLKPPATVILPQFHEKDSRPHVHSLLQFRMDNFRRNLNYTKHTDLSGYIWNTCFKGSKINTFFRFNGSDVCYLHIIYKIRLFIITQ